MNIRPERRAGHSDRTQIALTALGGAALLAGSLLVLPSANATTTYPAQPVGTVALPERFTKQQLAWRDCGDDIPTEIRCATIDAPIDYLRPDAGTLKVTFSKLSSGTAAKRRGVLFLNPGGPGVPGLDQPQFKRELLPKGVLEQYDLVGFDPRGVGRSTPISCGLTGDEAIQLEPYRAERFARDVATARSVAAKCAAAGPTAGHISTRNTARDMDLIRVLLREPKISYFGVSYGTYLGAVYTQLFPNRVDRFVLDSNIDPARAWRGVFEAMTISGHDDFKRFTRWAAERDSLHHLGTTPQAVEKTFWDLADRVERNPIQIDGQRYTRLHARSSMAAAALHPEDGVTFIAELRKALNGKPHELVVPEEGEPDDSNTSLYWSVLCNDDSTWPRDPQAYVDDVARALKQYPLIGDATTNIKPCAFWSLPRSEPDVKVGNDVPALIVQNEWDPFTPGLMGKGMHRALRGSRLVMVKQATTHGVYTKDGNPCAAKAVNAYLSTGVLPRHNVTCAAVAPK